MSQTEKGNTLPYIYKSQLSDQEVLRFFEGGGYDGIVNRRAADPINWVASSNVYRLKTGVIRRIRPSNIILGGTTVGLPAAVKVCKGIEYFSDPSQTLILTDWSNNKHYSHGFGQAYQAFERVHPFYASGDSHVASPWSRESQYNVLYEMNGQVKQKSWGSLLTTIRGWGITPPAETPIVAFSAAASGGIGAAKLTDFSSFAAGDRYIEGDVLVVTGGGGDGRLTVVSVDTQGVGALSLNAVGTGYTNLDVLTVQDGNLDCLFQVTVVAGIVTAIAGVDGMGSGYQRKTGVQTTGGTGTGLTVDITSLRGPIHDFSISTIGTGYTLVAGVALTGGSGSGASIDILAIQGGMNKPIGRNYKFAWVDPNTLPRPHVSAPSPATARNTYVNEIGTVNCIRWGTIAVNGTTAVVGTGTTFSQDDVGLQLWSETNGNLGYIASVTDATHLTLKSATGNTNSGKKWQVFDGAANSLNVRLYATADGGSVYFRIQDTNFNPASTTLAGSGLQFFDNDGSEPPDGQFTLEETEEFNFPPPVGMFVKAWQGRMLVFGVKGNEQTIYYSNVENTVVGVPTESFGLLNRFTLNIGSAQIKACAVIPTGLLILTDHFDMFRITGLLQDNSGTDILAIGSTMAKLPYRVGCVSQKAIAETPYGTFWYTPENQVYYWDDLNMPQCISLPIQDLLYNGVDATNVKLSYYRDAVSDWLVVSVNQTGSATNNKLLLFDIDSYVRKGRHDWYPLDLACEGMNTIFNGSEFQILCGGTDVLIDPIGGGIGLSENTVANAYVRFHAYGNESPKIVKQVKRVQVLTNRTPAQFINDSWVVKVNMYDDRTYYEGFQKITAGNPLQRTLTPGIDSPTTATAWEIGPNDFVIGGNNFIQGNRFEWEVDFPSGANYYELEELNWLQVPLPGR